MTLLRDCVGLVGTSFAGRDGESGSVSLSLELPLIRLCFAFLGLASTGHAARIILPFVAGTLEGHLGFICQFRYLFARGSEHVGLGCVIGSRGDRQYDSHLCL